MWRRPSVWNGKLFFKRHPILFISIEQIFFCIFYIVLTWFDQTYFYFLRILGGERVRERHTSLHAVKENEICHHLMWLLKFMGRVKWMNFDDINLSVVDHSINIHLYHIIIWELVNRTVFQWLSLHISPALFSLLENEV